VTDHSKKSCFKCDAHGRNHLEVSTSVVWLVVLTVKIRREREGAGTAFRLSLWFLLDEGLAGD
jgi:hypothetical protein